MATRFKSQDNYAARMQKAGHIKVSGWVPEGDREELLQIAKDMREEHEQGTREGKGHGKE